jgi:hypothetical protein
MKCPTCGSDDITFLGVWYTERSSYGWILVSHYGCKKCRAVHMRPVSENDYYYLKEDGTIIMRPTHVPLKHERRLYIVENDPGFYVRS